jgi:pimeloyl-ACP methyl ester carboxylesterase
VGAIDARLQTETGRTLAYAQTGDLDGAPVFYFHGTPGSRGDFQLPFNRPALDGLPVHVIGIDRPGFGDSDYQPRRRYADWPSDVLTVANALGIERLGVLAYSGGAPYAIACALAFPEKLTFVGIVSGVGPAEMPHFHRGIGTTDAVLSRLARWAPLIARFAIAQARKQAVRSPEKFSAQFDKELSAPDRALHADAEFRQTVRDLFLESTKQAPRGIVDDYRIWARPSDLNYDAVGVPVRIWHGDADAVVPMHHAEYVAARVPQAQLVSLPGVGHLHTAARWHEFLTAAGGQSS